METDRSITWAVPSSGTCTSSAFFLRPVVGADAGGGGLAGSSSGWPPSIRVLLPASCVRGGRQEAEEEEEEEEEEGGGEEEGGVAPGPPSVAELLRRIAILVLAAFAFRSNRMPVTTRFHGMNSRRSVLVAASQSFWTSFGAAAATSLLDPFGASLSVDTILSFSDCSRT